MSLLDVFRKEVERQKKEAQWNAILKGRARRIHQPRVRIDLDVFVPGKDTRAVRIMQ